MRTIQRTISLEPMTSRLPGVLPAYKDNVLYFFDDASLKKREYEFTSNYGMIPVNIMLDNAPSAATNWNLSYTSHCYGQTLGTDELCYGEPYYDEFGNFTLSWYSLSEWYKFFTDYYHLLNDWGHCGTAYSSATHYYSAESKNGYAPQMKYGTDKQTYIDMDELFKVRGGLVDVVPCDESKDKCNFDTCNSHTIISESHDKGFFKWICDNIVPSFTIPAQYKDYWKRDRLFYPDVITWSGWLTDRSSYGSLSSILECSKEADCCECEKWFKLGGNDILSEMNNWYGDIQRNILSSITESCAIPTIIEPINMQISADDFGEFSILSTDYELGIDYRTASYGDSANTHSGTVVTMDGSAMILSGGTGFIYNETYMEKYVSECENCGYQGVFSTICPNCGSKKIIVSGWTNYDPADEHVACSFEEYDKAYQNSPAHTDKPFYFTFDDSDKRISGETEDGLREDYAVKYKINKCDAILIGNSLYDIQKEEYGEYDANASYIGGKTFYVYREDYTDTPYTIVNGKKIYADFYPFKDKCDQFFYFPFFKDGDKSNDTTCSGSTFNPDSYKHFPRTRSKLTDGDYKEFITYEGTQHEVNTTGVTINEEDYIRINSGTCETPDGIFYITDGKIYQLDDGNIMENEDYSVVEETFEIKRKVDKNISVYVGGIISGETISKIYDLRSNSLLVDDIGNTIEALYNVADKYNHQPPEGEKLEPIYQVGNVANVNRFSITAELQEDLSGTTNYFVGDIITEMVFYYKDTEGNTIDDTKVTADTPTSGETTSLSSITKSTEEKERIEQSMVVEGNVPVTTDIFTFDDDIYCDITYYIGATLQRTGEDKPFELAEDTGDMTFNHGVRYTETVKFIEKDVQYYLKNVIKKQIPMTENTVSAHSISYPVTCYVMEQEKTRIESDFNNYYYCALAHFEMTMCTSTNDFELYNGTQTIQIFRQEYKIGTACIQNVDSDIYIDRGINAAFEKHIKLGEVTSMESLEQYTNGYFKIMEN